MIRDMNLRDFALQLTDERERERVLQALDDAATVPADKHTVDEVEARFGDGAGGVDVWAYVMEAMGASRARGEFEALMHAAKVLQVRMAFIEVQTPEGSQFVRIDKLQ